MRSRGILLAAIVGTVLITEPLGAIPYFARRYRVTCAQCHVVPPKLNTFGEAFLAGGYSLDGLTPRRTVPFAVWVSGRSDALPNAANLADDVRAYLNRIEIISGGKIAPALSYFIEWRALSQEARSDGTLRDRSGRFEDIFLTLAGRYADLTVGQFRQLWQVDVSRRLSLSEPLVLSSALPGFGAGSARRAFPSELRPGGTFTRRSRRHSSSGWKLALDDGGLATGPRRILAPAHP